MSLFLSAEVIPELIDNIVYCLFIINSRIRQYLKTYWVQIFSHISGSRGAGRKAPVGAAICRPCCRATGAVDDKKLNPYKSR